MSGPAANGAIGERWKQIYEAASYGDAATLERLLKHKSARTNFQQRFGQGDLTATPLTAAAYNGQLSCMKILLDAKAQINLPASTGATALSISCQHGHIEAAKLLLERGADMDIPKANGMTSLNMACLHGHVECVRLLLGAGARMEEAASVYTPESRASVEVLVGATPLWTAAREGRTEVTRLLLKAGALVDSRTACGGTPLCATCLGSENSRARNVRERAACAKLLLAAGADATILYKGRTPLEHATIDNSHASEVAEVLRSPPSKPEEQQQAAAVVGTEEADLMPFVHGAASRSARRRKAKAKTALLASAVADEASDGLAALDIQ